MIENAIAKEVVDQGLIRLAAMKQELDNLSMELGTALPEIGVIGNTGIGSIEEAASTILGAIGSIQLDINEFEIATTETSTEEEETND